MSLQRVRGRAVAFSSLTLVTVLVGRAQEAQPAVPAAAPAATESAMATVQVERTRLRCWPTANSPLYDDVFAKDAVLRVGRAEAGFREILLPIGPRGYVHRNFAGEPAEGQIATKGKGVAFRYRPRSGEAPVTSLAEGTQLWIVGQQEDWWCVRNPSVVGWLPEADVQMFPAPAPETLQKAHAEFEKLQRGEVQAYQDGIAKAAADRKQKDERQQELAALQTQFAQELQKAPKEQQLDPIATATDALLVKIGEDAELKPAAQELQRRIGAQKWVVEATTVRDEQPLPPKDLAAVPPGVVADPLDRFQSVGFLRWEKGLTGPGKYVIEKGGQPLYIVTCASGRYDLSLFTDCELGLVGSRRRPSFESLRVLDVEKIEVLAGRP